MLAGSQVRVLCNEFGQNGENKFSFHVDALYIAVSTMQHIILLKSEGGSAYEQLLAEAGHCHSISPITTRLCGLPTLQAVSGKGLWMGREECMEAFC